MRVELAVETPVVKTGRVLQLGGMFDVPVSERAARSWSVDLPEPDEPWAIGLIVGSSGSGKSTLARQHFGEHLVGGYEWPADKAVVDGFPAGLDIKAITGALSSVGFSSPPSWVQPFGRLSNGEQFRATLARALLDPRDLIVIDEFSSVVDRTVAKIGSAAVAKAVRRQPGKRFVAVTCHDDVEEWLCPDWVVRMPDGSLTRRSLRRPPVALEVRRVGTEAWHLFKRHHYLDASIHPAAACFVALWEGRPVAFTAVVSRPGRVSFFGEHRTVCLPDFQGVGLGNGLSEFVASLYKARKEYRSTTSNPAMIHHRARSPLWRMTRAPSRVKFARSEVTKQWIVTHSRATDRMTAGFTYVGPPRPAEAKLLGVL